MSEKGEISALDTRIAAAKKSGKKLSKIDTKLKKELGHLRVNANELTTDLGKIFKNKDLKAHFCWEAASGQTKFGNNGTHGAIANELVTFKQTGTLSNRLELDKPLGAGALLARQNDFYISEAQVNQGPSMKRFRPAAMGRATPIRKRRSHLSITISDEKIRSKIGSKV